MGKSLEEETAQEREEYEMLDRYFIQAVDALKAVGWTVMDRLAMEGNGAYSCFLTEDEKVHVDIRLVRIPTDDPVAEQVIAGMLREIEETGTLREIEEARSARGGSGNGND